MPKNTILIIDDEPNILSSLRRILETEDKDILLANSAEEAWEILGKTKEVKVIICDNKLPGVLGIDFLIKVKVRHPDTVRILMTGYPDLSSAMDAINRAHIWRYVLKPIEVEELKVLINQAFDYYRILRENHLLLRVARKQAEWLKALRDKHPQLVSKEVSDIELYTIDEQKISEIIEAADKDKRQVEKEGS